ncbi:MAG: Vitamin B12 transporter BtuB [uncultured Sulfurimonas sp.]|nr:MAG: Vitamin B12 transporter BtuB [uncultured Sulfurimonas sp.]
MKNAIKLSILSCALLSQLSAENQYTIETINVTASQGTTLNKKDVTDSVVIITKEAIDEARVTTVNEAINRLGGLSMTQSGGVGTNSSMFVRGMATKHILVLIDGVRSNNPVTGTTEFSQLMLSNIVQIEIMKGSQSGVYGSDASGGVINIITSKAKQGLHSIANVEYGSFDSKKASLQVSYAEDKYDILMGISLVNVDGFSAQEPGKGQPDYGQRGDDLGLEKDGYENKSMNVKLGYNISQNDRVSLNIQTIDSTINYDPFGGDSYSDTPNDEVSNRFYTVDYKHKGKTHEITVSDSLSTFDRVTTSSYPGHKTGSVNELRVDDKINYMGDSFVRVGASYQKFELEDVTAKSEVEYTTQSVFATNYNKFQLFEGKNTIITESMRYDKYDDFDDSLTGKLGVKQFVHNDIYVSGNIGTGYNLPTLYELTHTNIGLEPEKTLTYDITLGNDVVSVTGFYNEVTDLIDYDYSSYTYEQAKGTTISKGIELIYNDYFFDLVGVNAMYTYVEAEDTDGKELARRPKNQVDARATYYVDENWDLGVSAQYIGERYDAKDKGGAQTGDYTVVNFVSNVKVNKVVTVYGKIDNLTDMYYQTVDGYATAGRSLYVGLIAKY